jgi:hypothetical protein
VKRYRRLRRLQADADLVRRRAAGETLQELARDYGVSHTTLSRYFARPEVAKQLQQAGQLLRAEQRAARASLLAGQKAEREARRLVRRQVARKRTTPDRAHPDDAQLASAPGRPDRGSLQAATHEASQPEIADAQAAAAAAVCYVEELEAAYQHAFAAIETMVTAIERVQQLRGQERVWHQAQTLGVAPKRPEPWYVRAAFNTELAQLQNRFTRAHNSNW